MADPVTIGGANEGVSEEFAALAGLDAGPLGTGYTASVELSFVAMALILGWVAYETARYFLSGTRLVERVAQSLGLGDD